MNDKMKMEWIATRGRISASSESRLAWPGGKRAKNVITRNCLTRMLRTGAGPFTQLGHAGRGGCHSMMKEGS